MIIRTHRVRVDSPTIGIDCIGMTADQAEIANQMRTPKPSNPTEFVCFHPLRQALKRKGYSCQADDWAEAVSIVTQLHRRFNAVIEGPRMRAEIRRAEACEGTVEKVAAILFKAIA